MRLLAKTAEQRYQTAAGVERDLRRCLTQWEAEHRIDEFRLGEHETPDRLLIPETCTTRRARDRDAPRRVRSCRRDRHAGVGAGVRLSGIGKSSVVNELHKALLPPRGLFASGKFDQGKRGIPYATLAQAFQSLVRRLLATSDAELAVWRAAFEDALGPNGQLDDRPCPRTEADYRRAAAGPRAAASRRSVDCWSCSGSCGCSRGRSIRSRFSSTTCSGSTRPPSISRGSAARSDVRHVLVIGAFRNNEVGSTIPSHGSSRRRGGGRARDRACAPRPTGRGATNRGCAALGTRACRHPRAARLRQDGGQSLLHHQFLTALGDEGLLTSIMPMRAGRGISMASAPRYTDNVADLMFDRLARLPAQHNARCSRSPASVRAEVTTLALVLGMSADHLHAELWEGPIRIGGASRRLLSVPA